MWFDLGNFANESDDKIRTDLEEALAERRERFSLWGDIAESDDALAAYMKENDVVAYVRGATYFPPKDGISRITDPQPIDREMYNRIGLSAPFLMRGSIPYLKYMYQRRWGFVNAWLYVAVKRALRKEKFTSFSEKHIRERIDQLIGDRYRGGTAWADALGRGRPRVCYIRGELYEHIDDAGWKLLKNMYKVYKKTGVLQDRAVSLAA